MFINPAMTVTVSGGSVEDNQHLCSVIHQQMMASGFTNVAISETMDSSVLPLIAQLRNINPDLFDNKIVIAVNNDPVLQMPAMANNPVLPGQTWPASFMPFGLLGG